MSDRTKIAQFCASNRFAEVLPHGFEYSGASSGPVVLVVAPSPLAHAVFERLLTLPSLPWMCGKIRVTTLDQDFSTLTGDVDSFDELLCLPKIDPYKLDDETTKIALRTVLRLCARLGMISGRGLGDTRDLRAVA